MIAEWRSGLPPRSGKFLVTATYKQEERKRVVTLDFNRKYGWGSKNYNVLCWSYLPDAWNGRDRLIGENAVGAMAESAAYDAEIRAFLAEKAKARKTDNDTRQDGK